MLYLHRKIIVFICEEQNTVITWFSKIMPYVVSEITDS